MGGKQTGQKRKKGQEPANDITIKKTSSKAELAAKKFKDKEKERELKTSTRRTTQGVRKWEGERAKHTIAQDHGRDQLITG